MSEIRKTKEYFYNQIKDYILKTMEETEEKTEFIDFIDNELVRIGKRKEYDEKKRAEKKAEGDELTSEIYSILSEEPLTVDAIAGKVSTTRNKAVARLKKLVDQKLVIKEDMVIDVTIASADGKDRIAKKRVKCYSLAPEQLEVTEDAE